MKSDRFFAIKIRWLLLLLSFASISLFSDSAHAALTLDANISRDQSSSTITSPSFSTASGNELLLAFIAADYNGGANVTVTSVSGAGLTWVLVGRTNVQSGTAEIWRAFATSPLSSVTVTANLSQSVYASLTVMSFAGVDTSGTNGSGAIGATGTGNSSRGAPTASLTSTRNGSMVVGVGNDLTNAINRTVGANQVLVHQYLAPVFSTYWVQIQNGPTPSSGTPVTINDTAPTTDKYNLSICEVLPAISGGQTWSISGTLSPSGIGSGTTMALSGAATGTVTADASGNYSFPGLANGTYTVTPTRTGYTFTPASQFVTINGADVTAMNFAGQASQPPSIGIAASTSSDAPSASTTISTAPFSTTTGNQLLLAFVATDYNGGANVTVTSVSGGGLTWVLVGRTNVQSGTAEIWRAFATWPLSSVTVTANLSQSVCASLTVMSFTGADTSGTNGSGAIGATGTGNSSSGAPTASLTSTRNGSMVVGVGNDLTNAINRTVGANQLLIHQYLAPVFSTYWVQIQNGPIPRSGTRVSINDTAPTTDKYNLSICEVLPASAGQTWSISGTLSPSGIGSGTTVAISGAATGTVTADSLGNYSFAGLANGTYTVTPTRSGYTFTPASQSVTINGANATAINFTGQASSAIWSISGMISPSSSGGGATVALSGAATGTVTADSSGNYSFAGLANGTYTVTPTGSGYAFTPASQSVTINGGNVTGINFAGQASPTTSMGIAATTSSDASTASTTISTAPFSTTTGNQLLLAIIATDYNGGANVTATSVSGAGLTWVLVGRTNVQSGTAEIWRAFATSPLSSVTVTANLSQSVYASLTVMSFTGVDTSGTNGSGAIGATGTGNSSSGAPTASLTTTRNGSMVVGVGNDLTNIINRTVGANQLLVHQYLAPVFSTYWVQIQNGPTSSSGTTVTINDTAPTTDKYNLSICEILPASGGSINPTPPTVSMTAPAAGAVVTNLSTLWAVASDQIGVAGVQFLLDGSLLGGEVISRSYLQPYSMIWDSSSVASGSHTLAARARNTSGLTTTSAPVAITVDNSGNPAVAGSWGPVVAIPGVAVNLVLLKNNKVLFHQDGSPTVWDYVNGTFAGLPTTANIFCSNDAILSDGRVLITGGSGGVNSDGISNAEIFDPSNNNWTAVPNMSYKRWYPGSITLADGRVLVTAGWASGPHDNMGIPEIYDPTANAWTKLTSANNPFETYPFNYQLPDGRVIHVGGSEYATVTDILDLNTLTWSVVDPNIVDGGSSTMYLPAKIMKAGSSSENYPLTGPSSNTTYVLDMTQPAPGWQQTPSMAYPRSFLNLVTLPDGTVLAIGGETDTDGGNIANAVYPAELWSPQTQTWTTMAAMQTPREYHSTAVLLPDGRVLVSGMGATFGKVPDQKSAEFYSPPYLFKGARPTISQVPAQISYGTNFFVGTPDASSITRAVLIRTGAVTHAFNGNARYVPLTFQQATGGLNLSAPANANLAPPGYYMLFILNNAGIPSVAPFVQLQ